jgi:radical SAM superfamily enzyme YgiQ (UPF0313 family)
MRWNSPPATTEQIKLYFMLGLPTEEEDDVQALVDLALACAEQFPRQVTVNVTPFVPKAQTPFQRVGQTPAKTVQRRIHYVEQALRTRGIGVKSESPAWAEIQGTLSRGDQQLTEAILRIGRLSPGNWRRALSQMGLSAREFLRGRASDEPLPWDFVQSGVRRAYLDREAQQAGVGGTTGPCPPADCAACGACAE